MAPDTSLPSAYIEAVTKRVFPQASNNRFALIDCVKRLLDLVQAITVDEFAFIRANLNRGDATRDDEWQRLPARLELLSHRLEAEGSYVNADIVHQAFEFISTAARKDELGKKTGAPDSAVVRAQANAPSTIEASVSPPAGTQAPPVEIDPRARADVIEECAREIEANTGWVSAHGGWPSSMAEHAAFLADAVRKLRDYT